MPEQLWVSPAMKILQAKHDFIDKNGKEPTKVFIGTALRDQVQDSLHPGDQVIGGMAFGMVFQLDSSLPPNDFRLE